MKDSDGLVGSSKASFRLFTAVKYLVYLALCLNTYLFFQEELAALEHTFVDGFAWSQLIQVFSASIDTAAWVILLLMFELETSVLDDRKIRGATKWALHTLRLLCYAAIYYAFTGYYAELTTLYEVTPMAGFDACASLDYGWSLQQGLDDYVPLDADNCAAVGSEAYRLTGFDIIAPPDVLESARWLAWTDVINAGTWILVVIVLEVEVRLQLRGNLSDQIMAVTKWLKFALYGTLFVAAGYWGIAGSFLDFWDAALWLFAFIFIELNVFEWQHETSQAEPEPEPAIS